jgi:hypothetical protein
MSMSRKNYEAIAAVLAKAYEKSVEAKGEIADIAHELADHFVEDNSNFNRERFLEACGVQS